MGNLGVEWTHSGPAVLAAFLASLVEFVEALTIVLAVGMTRGWRSALSGAFAGVLFLTVLVLAFGPSLRLVPITTLQLAVGILLLLFGMR
jgi:Ca2+/H+ antiporter, TMEM165/GDT1 family